MGVEIRPPLDPEAAQGILEELLLERDYGYAALVAANITRQDNEGTVYTGVVKSNEYRGLTNSESMAHFIGKTIDPCGLHVIEYHGPDE